jgi:hypothetical protein
MAPRETTLDRGLIVFGGHAYPPNEIINHRNKASIVGFGTCYQISDNSRPDSGACPGKCVSRMVSEMREIPNFLGLLRSEALDGIDRFGLHRRSICWRGRVVSAKLRHARTPQIPGNRTRFVLIL